MRPLWQTEIVPSIPIEFLRGVLGVLCVFFAHMAGRSAGAVRLGRQRPSRLYMWIVRVLLCAVFVFFRQGLDFVAILVTSFSVIAFGSGMYLITHQKPPEDLTHEIFPE
jgi:hypothetical protein